MQWPQRNARAVLINVISLAELLHTAAEAQPKHTTRRRGKSDNHAGRRKAQAQSEQETGTYACHGTHFTKYFPRELQTW